MERGLRTRAAGRGGRSPGARRRADAKPGSAAVKTDILRIRKRRAGVRELREGRSDRDRHRPTRGEHAASGHTRRGLTVQAERGSKTSSMVQAMRRRRRSLQIG
ncbi:hypothetical protein PYW08_012535 [Mythimna loreyi]|uniref:Uncharacterized protein n=1 Tax=Mythimna loreyi TaxID=667449 RepID=A0ACC2Q2C0_9NEOP|nr:hypothetical protein PYW08_012535 [Mythimna loreyi]